MTKETMVRRAADNPYLHRDFHNILNLGLDYLEKEYGPAAVVGYLTDYAAHFHSPETAEIQKEGLSAVREIFQRTYAAEDAADVLAFEEKPGALFVRVAECPAVKHIKKLGDVPSRYYALTTSAVWREIVRRTDIGFEPLFYDPATGAAEYLFYEIPQNKADTDKADADKNNTEKTDTDATPAQRKEASR